LNILASGSEILRLGEECYRFKLKRQSEAIPQIFNLQSSIFNSPIKRDLGFAATPRAGSPLRSDRLSLSGLGIRSLYPMFCVYVLKKIQSNQNANPPGGPNNWRLIWFEIWILQFGAWILVFLTDPGSDTLVEHFYCLTNGKFRIINIYNIKQLKNRNINIVKCFWIALPIEDFLLRFLDRGTKIIPANIHITDVGIAIQPNAWQGEIINEFQTFGKVRYR
jgi:hypothetical protein